MFNGHAEISAQDIATVSTVQLMPLGTLGVTADRRFFRYGNANTAAAVPAGQLAVAEAAAANHTNLAVVADAAVGATSLTVTLGATAATVDQYAEGLIYFNAGTGQGSHARIKGHGSAALSTALIVYLAEPLAVAITAATTKASLQKNPWKDVILSTTVSKACGVPRVSVAALSYGWFQTRGIAPVLAGSLAIAKGLTVSQGTVTAGTVLATAAATSPVVGMTVEAAVATESRVIDLCID